MDSTASGYKSTNEAIHDLKGALLADNVLFALTKEMRISSADWITMNKFIAQL
jgi:hypothetical protein